MTKRLPARLEVERDRILVRLASSRNMSVGDVARVMGLSEATARKIIRKDMVLAAEAAKAARLRARMREAVCHAVSPTNEEIAALQEAERARDDARKRVEMAQKIARAREEEAELNRVFDEMTAQDNGAMIQ